MRLSIRVVDENRPFFRLDNDGEVCIYGGRDNPIAYCVASEGELDIIIEKQPGCIMRDRMGDLYLWDEPTAACGPIRLTQVWPAKPESEADHV